jgi:hypothetical protein
LEVSASVEIIAQIAAVSGLFCRRQLSSGRDWCDAKRYVNGKRAVAQGR